MVAMDDNCVLKIWFPIAVPKSAQDLPIWGTKGNRTEISVLWGDLFLGFGRLPRSVWSEIEIAPGWNTSQLKHNS